MEDLKVFIKDVRSINRLVVAVVVALLSPVNPNLFFSVEVFSFESSFHNF